MAVDRDVERVLARIREIGLLPESNARWPSLVTLVAGAPVRGSWWGHPRGRDIFRVSTAIADSGEAELVKLLAGKLTWVHRRLWSDLFAAASAKELWQVEGLADRARSVVELAEARGRLRADDAALRRLVPDRAALRALLDALERRLLVRSASEHTESGRHKRALESWTRWAGRVNLPARRPDPAAARARLEAAASTLGPGAEESLPWRASAARSRARRRRT
jgi:hypothetical protein